jgi:hypothetical protein
VSRVFRWESNRSDLVTAVRTLVMKINSY